MDLTFLKNTLLDHFVGLQAQMKLWAILFVPSRLGGNEILFSEM